MRTSGLAALLAGVRVRLSWLEFLECMHVQHTGLKLESMQRSMESMDRTMASMGRSMESLQTYVTDVILSKRALVMPLRCTPFAHSRLRPNPSMKRCS